MAESTLRDLSIQFAVDVKLCEFLFKDIGQYDSFIISAVTGNFGEKIASS